MPDRSAPADHSPEGLVSGRVVVLGELAMVAGFQLAGAEILAAEAPDAVRRAWAILPDDAALILLTPRAADALIDVSAARPGLLRAVFGR